LVIETILHYDARSENIKHSRSDKDTSLTSAQFFIKDSFAKLKHVRQYNNFMKHQWRQGKRHKYFYKDEDHKKFPSAVQFLSENCGA